MCIFMQKIKLMHNFSIGNIPIFPHGSMHFHKRFENLFVMFSLSCIFSRRLITEGKYIFSKCPMKETIFTDLRKGMGKCFLFSKTKGGTQNGV